MSAEHDPLVDVITAEVLKRLGARPPEGGIARPTLSAGGRLPLQLHEPDTFHSSAAPAAAHLVEPGAVVEVGTLDACLPCTGCGGCAARRPKTVREMIACGAARITSTAGWTPGEVDLAGLIDHTVLKPEATRQEIETLCAEAMQHGFAAVCVNPTWVRLCAEKVRGSRVAVCTVVGFPLGATLPEVKAYEATRAIRNGATEIDMVINVGELKTGNLAAVEKDIRTVVEACRPRVLTKVIIETALLTREEKIVAYRLAKAAGADFVKTSTGFSRGGATVEDVRLMREVVGGEMGVKASGGIREYDTAIMMVEAGATRLGTSASVKIVQGGARRSSRAA